MECGTKKNAGSKDSKNRIRWVAPVLAQFPPRGGTYPVFEGGRSPTPITELSGQQLDVQALGSFGEERRENNPIYVVEIKGDAICHPNPIRGRDRT